jgi:hypothetical protein
MSEMVGPVEMPLHRFSGKGVVVSYFQIVVSCVGFFLLSFLFCLKVFSIDACSSLSKIIDYYTTPSVSNYKPYSFWHRN